MARVGTRHVYIERRWCIKLTIKQQKFADECVIRGNAAEAAIAAGCGPKTAHRIGRTNLDKPHIKAYIQKRLDQIQSEKIADQEEILRYLTSIMRGGEQEPVLKDMDKGAREVIGINLQAKDEIKTAELLGKRYSLWTDKVDLDGGVSITFVGGVPLDD